MLSLNKSIKNFYIHIPFCIKKCHFCSFPIHAVGHSNPSHNLSLFSQYCSHLTKQIKSSFQASSYIPQNLQSIYFGGGTPSLLQSEQILQILNLFKNGLNKETQITVEINPEEGELEKIQKLMQIGVNRISIGVQSFNQGVLSEVNRGDGNGKQGKGRVWDRIMTLGKRFQGQLNLNLDFIVDFNIRREDKQAILQCIRQVNPRHLSLYMLQINQGSYIHRNLQKFKKYAHENSNRAQDYLQISKKIAEMGFEHYEVSNFCRKGFESKHNKVYWEGIKQFGAFGMGATSLTNKFRITRPKSLTKYYKFVESQSSSLSVPLLEIHNESSPQAQLQWLILSKIRCSKGFFWSELLPFTSQQKIQNTKNLVLQINTQKQNLIDTEWLNNGLRLKIPIGYLYGDFIGLRVMEGLGLM